MGDPLGAALQLMPSKRFSASLANFQHNSVCWLDKTFTQNEPLDAMRGHDVEFIPGKNPTSGGSSETEVNVPIVMPWGSELASRPVTITTDVGTLLSTDLKWVLSKELTVTQ